MDPMLLTALTAGVLAAGIVAVMACLAGPSLGWTRPRSASWLDEAMRTRLLVNTRDGQTIDGSLVRVDADGIILAPATYETSALAGSVWIPREHIAWVQQPPAPS